MDLTRSINPFAGDRTEKQAFFEKQGVWAALISDQLSDLQGALPGIVVDPDYYAARLEQPIPTGFVRVVVPKLSFLEKYLRPESLEADDPWDIYANIGTAVEHACVVLKIRRPDFKNYRKGELGSDRVRCNAKMAERRKADEALVPGDILVLDIHVGNYLGDKKTCHTVRYAREAILLSDQIMGLSAVDMGWVLVLNSKLLTAYEELSIDCTLEEYFVDGSGWVCSLLFYFLVKFKFDSRAAVSSNSYCAAVVAVRPGVRLEN